MCMEASPVYRKCDPKISNEFFARTRSKMADRRFMEEVFSRNLPFAEYLHSCIMKPKELKILGFREVEKGAINIIFRYEVEIKSGSESIRMQLYGKRYGPFFRKMPDIRFSKLMYDRGKYECVFIEKFKNLLNDVEYCEVPHFVFYDKNFDILVMEEIEGIEVTDRSPTSKLELISKRLGRVVGIYQRRTYGLVDKWYRPFLRQGKLRYYCPSWRRVIKKNNETSKALSSFFATTTSCKTSISHTDLSPKNVMVDAHGKFTIFDFEHSNYDDPVEDIGRWLYYFFIMLISKRLHSTEAKNIITGFLKAYRKEVSKNHDLYKDLMPIEERISKKIALLLLYRIDTAHLAGIKVKEEVKELLEKNCFLAFEKEYEKPEEYLENLILHV